jgi:hypothetical protein
MKERLLGTQVKEREWATRHLREGGEWIKSYWEPQKHSHRYYLIEKISRYSPISTVLEIGCNCRPNLYLLAKKFPHAHMVGIDINPAAIQKGKEWLAQEGISNVKLVVGKADELQAIPDKRFDIVFTDAVLIYIGPDKITKVVKELIRIARRALILVEWHYFEAWEKDPRGLGVYHCGNWKRNYVALLRQFVGEEQIHLTKITDDIWPDKNWSKVGAVIEVALE